jgi:hypothetical protein
MRREKPAATIADLRLFDTCVTLGEMGAGVRSLTIDNVLAVMDKHDIAEALVINNEARIRYPRSIENRRLLELTARIDRLHPVWALDPIGDPDLPTARGIVEEMLDAGVRVARLMMGVAPPLLWLWDNLLTALEERRIVCLLDFVDTGVHALASTQSVPDSLAIDGLRDVCRAHPDLPMILSHVSGGLGLSYPTLTLIRRVPNLHIDTTCIVDYWRVVLREVGPARVFFATGMPFYDPSMVVSMIQYANDVALRDQKAICGGNIRGLLEAVR